MHGENINISAFWNQDWTQCSRYIYSGIILVHFIVILLSQRPATFCSLENKDKEQAKQNYWTTKVQAK